MLSKLTDKVLNVDKIEGNILDILYQEKQNRIHNFKLNENFSLGANNNDMRKSKKVKLDKKLRPCIEQRFKTPEFFKIPPKFSNKTLTNSTEKTDNQGNFSESSFSTILNNSNYMYTSKLLDHRLTTSEVDIIKTNEKISQKNLDEIIKKNYKTNNPNDNPIIYPEKFNYQYIMDIEKIYEEMAKDLRNNGIKNLEYKSRLAASYLNIMVNENNQIKDVYKDPNNYREINIFLIFELSIYLCLLFINDFKEVLGKVLVDFRTLVNYGHLNFLYIVLDIVRRSNTNYNTNSDELGTNLNILGLERCKMLVDISMKDIEYDKYKSTFKNQNKILKNVLKNLLSTLNDYNMNIVNNLYKIFNLHKDKSYIQTIDEDIRINSLITEKINKISKNPETIENNIIDDILSLKGRNKTQEKEDSKEEYDPEDYYNLPKPDPPFLPEKKSDDQRDYVLVLDLDETLVHYFEDENEETAYVKVRMGTEKFITELSKYCEIVIFTASTQYYADIVINGLDCKDKIDYKLYRQHTTLCDGINIKDLSLLGRPIEKIIIIDNISDNFCRQPLNGLNISDFEGDEADNELDALLVDLLNVVSKPGIDVRKELGNVRKNMERRYANFG